MASKPRAAGKSAAKKAAPKKPAAKKPVARKAAARKTAPVRKPASGPAAQRPIQLYYWPTPNGWKVSIMLEEAGLPYEVRPVHIGKAEQFEPGFLKISPNNKIPAIVDPDGPGGKPIAVFESGAILQYLARKTGKLYPDNERQRVEVDQWLFWQVGGLGPMAGQAQHFRLYAPETIPYAVERYTNEVARLYGVLNRRLADRQFIAGRYSIADIACWGWVQAHAQQGIALEDFPKVRTWFDRVSARPAVKRGFAVEADVRQGAQSDLKKIETRRFLFGQRAR